MIFQPIMHIIVVNY